MKEVFQNYSHYSNWILDNYERKGSKEFTLYIEKELLIKKESNCNGQTHRLFTKEEFETKEKQGFIIIPN